MHDPLARFQLLRGDFLALVEAAAVVGSATPLARAGVNESDQVAHCFREPHEVWVRDPERELDMLEREDHVLLSIGRQPGAYPRN
ncbi:hypothetical protein [Streptomyces coffeae]|uniref:Uncharacterized protein n=1 Tax=Streptomyces coffeae TaxID=621382 RepID=A0ABS1N5Q6_9ACTN|nr:hypothetical protein [Streptomyces coffeae]MBL1095373.1 hypothetical protein [Streptomyces coffeae]